MSDRFYNNKSTVRGLYSTSRTEPDMRKELNATFDGVFPEIAKAQKIALRIMKKDDNNKLIPCACVDELTCEPDKDTFCPYCFGEGFYWEEILVDTYKVVIRSSVGLGTKEDIFAPGLINIPIVSFYFRSDIPINVVKDICPDKVVELETDTEGNLIRPYKRQRVYRIGTAIDFRSDHGKLEYWKLDCSGEQVKFLNGPKG
jgi:hypothetical protein